jgi:spore maturation protein CgeB
MKIIVLCATLDLSKPYGSTPALWQLFKGFYEEGHELLIIPYHGHPIDSIWWRSLQNPNYHKGMIIEKIMKMARHSPGKKNMPFIPTFANIFSKPKLESLIIETLSKEKNVEAVLMINVPLNQLKGLATKVRKHQNIPIIFYDVDVPTSLPSSGGFTFNHYIGADLGEYDSFIISSEGSISELRELGAGDINIVHFGVDPDVYIPISLTQDIDFFFFGNGGHSRAKNIKMMITEPSEVLNNKFVISCRDLDLYVGNATVIPPLSFTEWRTYCCRTKVNLNVVRELHANHFATSTSRPFELAALGCCIVSAPYAGLEKWFEIGKEVLVANSSKECVEIYKMLIGNDELRQKMGKAARIRVKNEHTARHRARQIIEIISRKNACSDNIPQRIGTP